MAAFEREIGSEDKIFVGSWPENGAIVADSSDKRGTSGKAADFVRRVLSHALARTKPAGSSSPKTRPDAARSSASPASSRSNLGLASQARRTDSRVAGGRSRAVSPVCRAICTTASSSAGVCGSREQCFDPAAGGRGREHQVDGAAEKLAGAETREAPGGGFEHFSALHDVEQGLAELRFGLLGQQLQTRGGAPHFAIEALVEAAFVLLLRQKNRREALEDIGLLIAIEAARDAAAENPPIDFALDLIAEGETARVDAARLFNAEIIAGKAEAGAQAEAGEVEPAYLVRRDSCGGRRRAREACRRKRGWSRAARKSPDAERLFETRRKLLGREAFASFAENLGDQLLRLRLRFRR